MRPIIHRNDALKAIADSKLRLLPNIDALVNEGFTGETEAEVIYDWVNYSYGGSPNNFIAELYEFVSGEMVVVSGEPDDLSSCPCCGLRTLTEPGDYDICRWCGWEDEDRSQPIGTGAYSPINRGSISDYRTRLREQERHEMFHRWLSAEGGE